MSDYQQAVDYLLQIPKFGENAKRRGKTGNPNLAYVMEKLGNPHLQGKTIHIAGTNGKGSTVRFTKCILEAMGYRVGTFTSPHLVRINERINIRDDISDEDFARCFHLVKEKVEEAVAEGEPHLSFFEFLFAMAAVYFSEEAPDYVIYETGLGGKLDATNLLQPQITAITAIGLEHTEYLGDTISKIAGEKAGIIKQGIPVVYLTGEAEADLVVEEEAKLRQAEAINVAKSEYIINEFTDKGIDFSLRNRYYKYENILLGSCLASYQVKNAALAITLCNRLLRGTDFIPQEMVQEGMNRFYWPGRMEKIHPRVILDGAHNPNAIREFVESVKAVEGKKIKTEPESKTKPLTLLFAVNGDKDYVPMISILCENLNLKRVYVTSISSSRGISARNIAEVFERELAKDSKREIPIVAEENLKIAFSKGFDKVCKEDEILYCVGSLYLIGSIKEIAPEVLEDDKF